eukprot:9417058-Alexandrium_andersonii.AAC.1
MRGRRLLDLLWRGVLGVHQVLGRPPAPPRLHVVPERFPAAPDHARHDVSVSTQRPSVLSNTM